MTDKQIKRLEMELSRNQEFTRFIRNNTKPVDEESNGLFLLPIIMSEKGWSLKDFF